MTKPAGFTAADFIISKSNGRQKTKVIKKANVIG